MTSAVQWEDDSDALKLVKRYAAGNSIAMYTSISAFQTQSDDLTYKYVVIGVASLIGFICSFLGVICKKDKNGHCYFAFYYGKLFKPPVYNEDVDEKKEREDQVSTAKLAVICHLLTSMISYLVYVFIVSPDNELYIKWSVHHIEPYKIFILSVFGTILGIVVKLVPEDKLGGYFDDTIESNGENASTYNLI
eukprot:NODE_1036_length_2506_cov_0.353552.p2 type:complete len:192 gc:universal NODE_1036_length_2506_cov_0.353552:989-414(-)